MIKIWFEPHSTSLDNEAHVASGWNDIDLSELGIQRALEWPARCQERKLKAIFCSDMQRCVKSAIPVALDFHLPVYIDKRLRECNYGELTQKPKELVEAEKISRISKPFPNGESYEQCIERMKEFLDWLKTNFDNNTVMIVGHRATQYGLEYWINNKPLKNCVTDKWNWQPGWEYTLV